MPICPKCGKLISEKRYARHLRRCGTSHKHETMGLYSPSATPPWEGVQRGVLVGAPSRNRKKGSGWGYALVIIATLVVILVLVALLR